MLPLIYLFEQIANNSGSNHSQFAKLVASDGNVSDYFGWSVSISGDGNTAIVGAYGDDDKGSNSGSAYIFVRNGNMWNQQAKLVASDGAPNDNFGWSVSISGDGNTAIIGAYGNDDKGSNSGSAYIFVRNGNMWTQQYNLIASDGATNDSFGYSVSISNDGNTAIIGASGDNNITGSAYIFTRNNNTWSQQSKLIASDGTANDNFGWSVSISGDGNTAIIGAILDDSKGSAYIFTKNNNTWSQQSKLIASDGAANHVFGVSVSMDDNGNTAIIGASGNNNNTGSAYIFTKNNNTWSQQSKLIASDGAANDYFGYGVSINSDGNTTIIGAKLDDDKGTDSGSAYIFTKNDNTWTEQNKLTVNDGAANDNFGHSVSISSDGNTIILSSMYDDDKAYNSGSAYIFVR